MILVVSNGEEDGHVRPVRAELRNRGAEVAVFDPAGFPQAASVTVDGSSTDLRAHLRWAGGEVRLDLVEAVWYRRPGEFALPAGLLPDEDKWLRTECTHLFRALWNVMPGRWVSQPDALRRASIKVQQLREATALGFDVPRFVITNDPDVASEFIGACPAGAVVKVLASPAIVSGDRVGALYTHLVTEADLAQIASVELGPTFLQEFVTKQQDVRVTVIGDQVFAVAIQSSLAPDARIDFRQAEVYDLAHTPLTLPPRLSDGCRELVRRLGLRFGAIDLLLTPDGKYVFLEINPNGQWYWLEQLTGIQLTAAMCDLLMGVGR